MDYKQGMFVYRIQAMAEEKRQPGWTPLYHIERDNRVRVVGIDELERMGRESGRTTEDAR